MLYLLKKYTIILFTLFSFKTIYGALKGTCTRGKNIFDCVVKSEAVRGAELYTRLVIVCKSAIVFEISLLEQFT